MAATVKAAAAPAPKLTAGDVCTALHTRYGAPSQGKDGEQYIRLEEARAGAGFNGNAGRCDFLAINTWPGRGIELIGHEVKVSMSDWRAELAQQDKAERFARYCNRWYVAVPFDLAAKIKEEVPEPWGLISVSAKGRCTEIVKAPRRREVEPVPVWWWIGWLSQIDRQHKRAASYTVDRLMAAEREKLAEQVQQQVDRRRRHAEEANEKLRENATALREATGIDLQYASSYQFKDLATAWSLMKGGVNLGVLASQLRKAADSLEAVSEGVSATS